MSSSSFDMTLEDFLKSRFRGVDRIDPATTGIGDVAEFMPRIAKHPEKFFLEAFRAPHRSIAEIRAAYIDYLASIGQYPVPSWSEEAQFGAIASRSEHPAFFLLTAAAPEEDTCAAMFHHVLYRMEDGTLACMSCLKAIKDV